MFERERTEVAEACRRLAEERLVIGTAGNVSAKAGDDAIAVSPTGAVLAEVAPEQVSVVDLDGNLVKGDLKPASELGLHLGIYERYDAGAVVHTHAPMATALACVLDDELPCVHYSMLLLGGSVRVAPYETFGTPELAAAVLVRPVEAIPEGQGGALVDEIKITAAGSAGGTAITLAKLGAKVLSAGAIGSDAVGDMLVSLLERDGIDTRHLVRRDDVQTSASVLPIRPSGERPALHVIGANATYGPDDVPWDALRDATHLHLGGPEFMAARQPPVSSLTPARTARPRRRTSSLRASRPATSSTGSRRRLRSSTTCSPMTSRCS